MQGRETSTECQVRGKGPSLALTTGTALRPLASRRGDGVGAKKRGRGRALVAVISALLSAAACGSDAVGIETCRRIESARCEVADACGDLKDLDDCQRYYRDQCLHGLGVPEPSTREVDECVAALQAAAECARAEESSGACQNACRLMSEPGRAPECAFLITESIDPVEPEGGSGGDGGRGGEPADAGAGGS